MKQKIIEMIENYKMKWKSEPTINYLSNYFKISGDDILKILNKKDEIKKIETIEPAKQPEIINPVKQQVEKKHWITSKIFWLKIIMFICFILSYWLGIQNNFIGFSKETSSIFSSWMKSILFFTFSVSITEAAVLFFLRKNPIWILFFIISIATFSGNFLTILSGQYVDFKNKIKSHDTVLLLKSYEIQESDIRKVIYNFEEEKNKLKNINSKDAIQDLNNIRLIYIPRWQLKLNEIIDKKNQLLLNTEEKTFLDNKNLLIFKFIMTSLIFELISSISLGIIFFLKEKEIKN